MSDYTDINYYIEKAKYEIRNAIRLVKTMDKEMKDRNDYQTLLKDLNSIIGISDECEYNVNNVTDAFEEIMF